jgi:hypothetical protein
VGNAANAQAAKSLMRGFDPIGRRFTNIENAVAALEQNLDIMRDMLVKNNSALQEILTAIESEKK